MYLASASPRRIAFLLGLGLEVSVSTPPANSEPEPFPGEDPASYTLRAAQAKADAVQPLIAADLFSGATAPDATKGLPVIIAADTVVVLENRILGKPEDPAKAMAMISSLAGKTHSVITGCIITPLSCPARSGDRVHGLAPRAFAVQSRVTMWDCPPGILLAYANSGEPLDKAGAYAVQGAGAFLVQSVHGSWSNVVGLPLAELLQALLEMRVVAPLVE